MHGQEIRFVQQKKAFKMYKHVHSYSIDLVCDLSRLGVCRSFDRFLK